MDDTTREALVAALQGGAPIVCYAQCVPCQFGQCRPTPTPHPWAGPDDIEHAAATGRPEPTGNCACDCARVES
ncbi:hypothetical protein ACFV9E_06395 [Streptomyces sp. NPDC059835]|uniref:hypothetical protein n=1 Tax=Streptomyces sp. NPDC059835 TaxID=3346967 RepID=UPI00365C4985